MQVPQLLLFTTWMIKKETQRRILDVIKDENYLKREIVVFVHLLKEHRFKEIFLICIIVNFYPIAVRIFKINLMNSVRPVSDLSRIAIPVSKPNVIILQLFYKCIHRWDAKTNVRIFIMTGYTFSALDQVKLTVFRNLKPSVFAIVKRFGDLCKADYVFIKIRTFFQVENIDGDVV